MKKAQAIGELLDAVSKRPIIFTTGYTCRIAKSVRDDPGHFYMVGSMGLSACIAAGVAIATGAATIVVDGDGSLLMNPGALIVVGSESALPVLHILLDDGCYASTGGQHTASDRVDFERLALASGYKSTSVVDDAAALRREIDGALRDLTGPVLIHCRVQADDGCTAPRIDLPLPEITARFSSYIASQCGPAGRSS